MTVAASDLLGSSAEDAIDEVEDKADVSSLTDSVGQLGDSADQLEEGSGKITNGLETLKDGTYSLKKGADTLADGAASLETYTSQLADGTSQISTAMGTLDDGIKSIRMVHQLSTMVQRHWQQEQRQLIQALAHSRAELTS